MAPIIRPEIKSPRISAAGADSTGELAYHIFDAADDAEAFNLLASTAPAALTVDGYLLAKLDLEVTPTSHRSWRGTANYSKRSRQKEELQVGESSFSFETGGGSTHISHARATAKYPNTSATPDVNNAINFDGEAVNGTDITTPNYTFSETHILAAAAVDAAYKAALFAATGRVNNGTFRGFAAGEVLFLGASGSKRGDDDWEITFRFSASQNATNLTVGGITGVNKKGWEYLWVRWDKTVDTSSGRTRPTAVAVYVQEVYAPHDFSNLGIGT